MMLCEFRWLGEDLSIYSAEQDLRLVDNPAVKNIVKGYAAFVSPFRLCVVI